MPIGSTFTSVVLGAMLLAHRYAGPVQSGPPNRPAANHGLTLRESAPATSRVDARPVSAPADQGAPDPVEPAADEMGDELSSAPIRESSKGSASPADPHAHRRAARDSRPLLMPPQADSAEFRAPKGDAGPDAAERSFSSSLPVGWRDIAQVGGALTLVISLLLITRRVLARSSRFLNGGARPSGVLEVLGRYPLGRGHSLVLLKLARRVLLVHQNGTAMSSITEITDPEEVANLLTRVEAGSSGRDAMRFRTLLRQFQHEHEHPVSSRRAGITLEPEDVSLDGEADLVDLTRTGRHRGLAGLFGRKGRS